VASQPSVLVACKDYESRCALASILADFALDLVFASSVDQARAILLGQPIRLVLCEDTLPDGSFRDVLHTLKLAGSGTPLVVCSLLGEIDEYLEAMESGAFDFIAPPFRPTELESIVNSALNEYSPERKKRPLAETANLGWAQERKVAS
jgi:two-component system response regulator (stage 0 sporulation protein F)